eukprot:5172328-Amphidinium_carterae.1
MALGWHAGTVKPTAGRDPTWAWRAEASTAHAAAQEVDTPGLLPAVVLPPCSHPKGRPTSG